MDSGSSYYSKKIFLTSLLILLLKMCFNDTQKQSAFLIPSSIPRILQSNRHSCALQTSHSGSSAMKSAYISPKKNQCSNQYTFQPKVNSSNKARRSLQKFVEDQQRHQMQKERKVTEMRDEITRWQDEEITGVPQINSISKTLHNEKSQSVFERLSKQKSVKDVMKSSYCFSPNILPKSKQLQRDKTASNLLYEDAKRRSNKKKVERESEDKKISSMSSPKINANTNDLVRRKILSEFMNLISDSKMNPLLALSVLEELFNVKLRDISSISVRKIIELLANEDGEVQTEKLWSFIAVIIGNGEGCFPAKEQNQIRTNYGYFYKERMNREKKKAISEFEPSFQPKTCLNSETLASKHRQKLCKRANEYIQNERSNLTIRGETIALEDLFIIEHQQRIRANEKLRLQKQNIEMSQCTFKPKLSASKPVPKQKQKIVLKHPLRPKQQNGQTQPTQTTERIPNSISSAQKSRQHTERVSIDSHTKRDIIRRNRKSIDNSSLRMMMARSQRDFFKKMSERGYYHNENWIKDRLNKHKEIIQNSHRLRGFHHG